MTETICIIGGGFVGSNLIDVFQSYYNVIVIDISIDRIVHLIKLYGQNKNITVLHSDDCSLFSNELKQCILFCIAVPTILTSNNEIDDTHIKSAIQLTEKYIQENATVIIESSVYVGMTRKLLSHLTNKNIYVGFSPERIDSGRINPTPKEIPKIISGINQSSLEQINKIYSTVFHKIIPVSSLETAEISKLVENCFRMINIAYINEIDDACKQLNLNTDEIIDACSSKPFGFMPFYRSLGVGGHCIPINPFWLAVTSKDKIPLLMQATEYIYQRPKNKAHELINQFKNLNKILIVGFAFKSGEKTITNSPSLSFVDELLNFSLSITIFDPMVDWSEIKQNENIWNNIKNVKILDEYLFTTNYLDDHFDVICICLHQTNVDWNIIKQCQKIKIVDYCKW